MQLLEDGTVCAVLLCHQLSVCLFRLPMGRLFGALPMGGGRVSCRFGRTCNAYLRPLPIMLSNLIGRNADRNRWIIRLLCVHLRMNVYNWKCDADVEFFSKRNTSPLEPGCDAQGAFSNIKPIRVKCTDGSHNNTLCCVSSGGQPHHAVVEGTSGRGW